jgi:hypothetical protein
MRSRKQLCVAALSLFSALALIVAGALHSPTAGAAWHAVASQPKGLVQPAAYVASTAPALAADMIPLDIFGGQRVNTSTLLSTNPLLPDVEEFTLTPPNPDQGSESTMLSVRFNSAATAKMSAQIPMTLGQQNVVMQRSLENPSVYFTQVDFNWERFIQLQQRRKQLAAQGKSFAVYNGRNFLGKQMQYIEPGVIQKAIKQHQAISFTSGVLLGGDGAVVVPDHHLMVIDTHVVEDGAIEQQNGASGRTYDACISADPGNQDGAWTFKTLWMAALNTTSQAVAEQKLDDFLYNWQHNLTVNGFTVKTRPDIGTLASPSGGGSDFLANWPVDTSNLCSENGVQTYCPSLIAPVRLNAIVNRIDLAGQPNQTNAGELRFVFGVTAGNQPGQQCASQSAPPFNIIFEYHVPQSYTLQTWATAWKALPTDNFAYTSCPADGCYVPLLQSNITDNVVKATSCKINAITNTCLFHIRTNEVLLNPGGGINNPSIWELREFKVTNGNNLNPNSITEIAVDQTPSDSFNFGGGSCYRGGTQNGEPACTGDPTATATYIVANNDEIDQYEGTQPLVPQTYDGNSFLGGSSLNAFENGPGTVAFSYWNTCSSLDHGCTLQLQPAQYDARRYFSANTCNGCHGFETNNNFQHVFNRVPGQTSSLSNFLVGCAPNNNPAQCGTAPGPDSCAVGNPNQQQCALNLPGQEQVPDPAHSSNDPYNFGDIANRVTILQTGMAPGNELFLPFLRPHIGVH